MAGLVDLLDWPLPRCWTRRVVTALRSATASPSDRSASVPFRSPRRNGRIRSVITRVRNGETGPAPRQPDQARPLPRIGVCPPKTLAFVLVVVLEVGSRMLSSLPSVVQLDQDRRNTYLASPTVHQDAQDRGRAREWGSGARRSKKGPTPRNPKYRS
jgi:hypothetical protein